jgi:hypothetical protein
MVWRGPSIRPRAPQQSDYFGVSVRNPQHVRLRVGVRGLRLCQQGRLISEAQPRPGEVEPAQRLTNCGKSSSSSARTRRSISSRIGRI